MHRATPRTNKPIDITNRRIPEGDVKYKHISGCVNSGASVLRAGPLASASSVSKSRSEIFGRIKPLALLAMLVGESGSDLIAEEETESIYRRASGGGGGGGAGASVTGSGGSSGTLFVTVAASDIGSGSSPVRPSAASSSATATSSLHTTSPDILILDARSNDVADLFSAVHITGALHVPSSFYLTQDRLPNAVHAARRATPQPVVVVYDESGSQSGEATLVAEKLVAVGKFDAAVVLDGGLRGAALFAPTLLVGSMSQDFIAGVKAEYHVNQPRSSARRGGVAQHSGRSSIGGGGGGGGGGGEGSVYGGNSVSSAVTRTSVSSFGASKRW